MFTKLKQYIAERKHKKVIATLRSELLFWGYDTSDMSDEELEKKVSAATRSLAVGGISAEQFHKVMQSIADASLTK